MANCLPLQPVNPINQILIDVFGQNYAPPFNTGSQPTDKMAMVNDQLLQFQFPGGGAIKPTGEPHTSMGEILAAVAGQIAPIFAFFGPLFIILDLLRAIIDIVCSFFNPTPLIRSVVDLFITVLPPVVALFPPFSSILLALNAVKLITSIIVSIVSIVIPIIDQIVEAAAQITALITTGDIRALDAITIKICSLLQEFANQIGGSLAPVSFIIELLNFFMSLGGKLFCATDATCCDEDNCPAVISNPSSGTATVLSKTDQFSLASIGLASEENDFVFVQASISIFDPTDQTLGDLNNFIVDPEKLSSSQSDPATIRVRVVERDINNQIIKDHTLNAYQASESTLFLRGDQFDIGAVVEYTVIPDKTALMSVNLIGLGCQDDVAAAAEGLATLVNENTDAVAVIAGSGSDTPGAGASEGFSGLDPLATKLGESFPPLPDFSACLAAQTADPSVSQSQCVLDIATDYLDNLTEFFESVVCLGASRTKSEFEISKITVIADGRDFATITLKVKEIGGANLLLGALPNARFSALFTVSGGSAVVGPTIFDAEQGLFMANISGTTAGTTEISASFFVRQSVCMRPGIFDGFTIVDKILNVQLVPEGGAYRRRRQQTQFIQAAGGRRR